MDSAAAADVANPTSATAALWQRLTPRVPRAFHCRCGRPVFFGNTRCLACGSDLGYDPEQARVLAIERAGADNAWRASDEAGGVRYRRCIQHSSAVACSWLLGWNDAQRFDQCRSCRLNRMLPDLTQQSNQVLWARVERDKQRLVAALIALKLPVSSRTVEDSERGLAFDLLHGGESTTPVMTGHHDGITVLGHLRHESGHYYWARLVDGTAWLESFRKLFGDERADYGEALKRHHGAGPPADWPQSFVSAYASAHPWEDWAETWAHHLHIVDTLDTALSFGVDASASGLLHDPFRRPALRRAGAASGPTEDARFLDFINAWIELTAALNELSRSMGERDFYPFVLSAPAVAKLHLVYRIVNSSGAASL